MRLSIYSLFSGSGGNCTYLRYGDHRFLIDAGRSCRAICRALSELEVSLDNIEALFLTHNHSDHTGAVDVLCKKAPHLPIYLTDACRQASVFADSTLPHLRPLTTQTRLSFAEVDFLAFPLPHDSADCVGYRIETPVRKIGHATDIGFPTKTMMEHLCGCDYVVLESNHDIARLKNGPYPESLKRRILSQGGHLSNDDAAKCAQVLSQFGTRRILLAHLSEENNTPDLALAAMQNALCQSQYPVKLRVAAPNAPVCLIDRDL